MENNQKKKGHGFVPDIIEEDNYVLGGFQLPTEILQPTGQWHDFLPDIEFQRRNNLETMNCVAYGTLNAIEILFRRLFNEVRDYSERYIGVMAMTNIQGNSPHKVIETIRKKSGLIDEDYLPFSENIKRWDEYYYPNPMTKDYIKEGKKWLQKYSIGHEWVFKSKDSNKQEKIKEALKYSPVAISLHLQILKNGLYYKGERKDNHWVILYGYKDNKYWEIFDSYDNILKRVDWNYDFGFAKRYHLEKRKKSFWQSVRDYIKLLFD